MDDVVRLRMLISRLLARAAEARSKGDLQHAAQLVDAAMAMAEKVEALILMKDE